MNLTTATRAVCLLALLLPGLVAASSRHDTPLPLRGPPFSDPDLRAPVSPGWESQPIEHAEWAKGAQLAVSLDQGIYPALLPAIQRFARDRQADIAVQEGTCGITAGALNRRQSDIGGLCCPPGIEDRLPGLEFHTLGIAPIALVTQAGNPVEGMTLEDARDLYRGKRLDWSAFKDGAGRPGPAQPVRPVTRLHCKTRPGHWRLLLDNEDQFGPQLMEVSTIDDMLHAVAADPGALGWEVLWMVGQYRGAPLKVLKVDGHRPEEEAAVARGDYRLYRVYNLTTWGGAAAQPLARELVAHLVREMEREGHRYGVVPASRLRAEGWRFRGAELIGEPE